MSCLEYNIKKANRTDSKVQNLASYINADTMRAIHKTMDGKKASGIDKVTKEEYGQNLEKNLLNLIKRMKSGSYRPNPIGRVYMDGKKEFFRCKVRWWRVVHNWENPQDDSTSYVVQKIRDG